MTMRLFVVLIFWIVFVFVLTGQFAAEIKPKAKPEGTIYYMNPDENKLIVYDVEPGTKKISKVFCFNQDYTMYVKELIAAEPLNFASGKMLIFGSKEVELKSQRWTCEKGIIFIPGEKEILIIVTSNIIYDEKNQRLTSQDATVKRIDLLDNNKEEKKELKEINLDLSIKR